jgi:hypothetical protein
MRQRHRGGVARLVAERESERCVGLQRDRPHLQGAVADLGALQVLQDPNGNAELL